MSDPVPDSREIQVYSFFIVLCVIMIAAIALLVYARCSAIFQDPGSDCGVGIGWPVLVIALIIAAAGCGYRVWLLRRWERLTA